MRVEPQSAMPARSSLGRLLLLSALSSCWLPVPLAAQAGDPPVEEDLRLPLKVVSAKIQRLPSPMSLIASGRAMEVDEALLLKTAVSRRSLDRLPPARQPILFLDRHSYPVFRQEPSNWDLREERPLDPERPVGEVQFLYFLIPDWRELPESAVPILTTVGAGRREPATAAPPAADPLLEEVEGSSVFRREAIVDRRP